LPNGIVKHHLVAVDRLYGNEIKGEVIKIALELGIDKLILIGTFDLGIASFPPAPPPLLIGCGYSGSPQWD
jgi:hypothetical protein